MVLSSLKLKVISQPAIHNHSTAMADHEIGEGKISRNYAFVRNHHQKRLEQDLRAESPSKK